MLFSEANAITASLCKRPENVLENENILRKNLIFLQQNCNLLEEQILKSDFIKTHLDM